MPITAKAVDARWNVLEEMSISTGLEVLLLTRANPTGLARYIDEYGDTIFNRLQVRDFLEELTTLIPLAADSETAGSLSGLCGLARTAIAKPHRFLLLEGD